jgi:hypothetical protein
LSSPCRWRRRPGRGFERDDPGARHPRQGRDIDRNARVQGRRAHGRNRAEGLRRARLHQRAERLQQQLPRRLRAGFHKGFQSIGADYNDVVITSELLDSASLFLTGNADTVYYLSVVDLSKGPMVIEQPSDGVGTINDMWFSWIIDVGGPGPDRGEGGKYLIVGPDYDGPLPEGGYFVAHSKTNRALYASRAYLVNDDPKPAVENIKANMKIYPYRRGATARASPRR